MDTIFAPITNINRAGVLIIRISGIKTIEVIQKIAPNLTPIHQKVSFAKIRRPENLEILDESLISFFKAPNSFTGEDVAEISIHASKYILKELSGILLSIDGVRQAEAGEFSKRAFLNNKIDLIQAESIPDLIAAETKLQHRQAASQLEGGLGKIYDDWLSRILSNLALIEAAIDFPEDDLPEDIIDNVEKSVSKIASEISLHLNDNRVGQKIKDGLDMVIIGPPNSGKSSLINLLTKSEAAIVSEVAGTTRDYIERELIIADFLVRVTDTAGLRDSDDKIEMEGVKRAENKAKMADLKIFMIDANAQSLDDKYLEYIDNNTIILLNKIDNASVKPNPAMINALKSHSGQIIKLSIKHNQNIDQLFNQITSKIEAMIPSQNNSNLITQERYRKSLSQALESLDYFDLSGPIELAGENLRIAISCFNQINGQVNIENILDEIFFKFCVGK